MKNIGVFGDSFAHRFNPRVRHDILDAKDNTQYMAKLLKVFPTWMEFIRDDTTSVTSHAVSGTDIIWSFTQFEKHHEVYDKVIFLLTSPGRISINYNFDNTIDQVSVSSIQRTKKLQDKYRDDTSEQGRELYNTSLNLEKWHELCTVDGFLERECISYNLVIERIKQLRPDAKFIRSFSNFPKFWLPPNGKSRFTRMGTSLHDILEVEDKILKYDQTFHMINDVRQCHLTTESHEILAGQIKKWLITNKRFLDIDLLEFEDINPDPKKYFVSKHKTFDDWSKYNLK